MPPSRLTLQRLLSVPAGPRPWHQVVLWWELRRIPYNAVVGIVGLFNLFAFAALASLRPGQFQDGPEPLAVLLFGFGANVCYTGGWIGELQARGLWGDRAAFFGPVLLSLGWIFSVALCFLPTLVAAMVWITTRP